MASNALPLAKTSISLSFLLSGVFLGSSAISVPALLAGDNSSSVARQWNVLYSRGLRIAPSLAIGAFVSAAASSLFYTQLYHRTSFTSNRSATAILLSGAVTLLSMPWTVLAMKSTNDSLINLGTAGAAVGKEKLVQDLVQHWGVTNYIRGVFPLVGAAIGIYFL